MAAPSKHVVSSRERALADALFAAGAAKKAVLKKAALSQFEFALYQRLRSKGIISTTTEGHGRSAKTMVKLLVEPTSLELSQRGTAQPVERGGKPSVEKMLALCELILREERLAEAARSPEPKLLRELDEIKAAFTRAIGENDLNRMVELGHDLARINKEIERSSGKFDPRTKAFERVSKNPEHSALAPYLRFLSAKQG